MLVKPWISGFSVVFVKVKSFVLYTIFLVVFFSTKLCKLLALSLCNNTFLVLNNYYISIVEAPLVRICLIQVISVWRVSL